jgi:hypothetical protein
MGDDENAAGRRMGGAYVKRLRMLGTSSMDALPRWLHGGDGPFLLRLAEAGVTAVSFDAWQHGQRTNEPLDQLMTRAFGQFRRNVWPILGHITPDAMRVLDWAVDRN